MSPSGEEIVRARLSFHKLEVFKRVVEVGSVTKVAEELYISQPVVSEHLRTLEEIVGTQLFFWERRTLRLTAAGEIVYDLACAVWSRTAEALRMLEGVAQGTAGAVVVGSTATLATYRLPPILLDSSLVDSGITVTLETYTSNGIAAALMDGLCDVAAIMAGTALPRSEVVTEHVGYERLVLVAAGDAEPPVVRDFDDLAALDFVCAPRSQARRAAVEEMLREHGAPERRVKVELSHPEAIKHAVRRGLGVAFLHRCSVAAELAEGTLVELPLPGPPLRSGVSLCYRKNRRFSAAQTRVIDLMRARLASDADPS